MHLFDGVCWHVNERSWHASDEGCERHAGRVAHPVHLRERALARLVDEEKHAEGRHGAHHRERQEAAKQVTHVDVAAGLLLLHLVRVEAVEDGVGGEARAAARGRLEREEGDGPHKRRGGSHFPLRRKRALRHVAGEVHVEGG
jgi:hypothetical protein